MNQRKHHKTSIAEIRACLQRGMSLRETAAELNCSLQGLRQAASLLEDLEVTPQAQDWRQLANVWGNAVINHSR